MDPAALIFFACLYALSCVAVGAITYIVVNPYGHLTERQALGQALWVGALWPFLLAYAVGVYVWYGWIKGE